MTAALIDPTAAYVRFCLLVFAPPFPEILSFAIVDHGKRVAVG
jgi:hypothetical protein